MNIALNIRGNHLSAAPDWKIVAGSVGKATFTANFHEDWTELEKEITWKIGDVEATTEVPENGEAAFIPPEVLIPGYLRITVTGTSQGETVYAAQSGPIHIAKAGATEGEAPNPFTG